MKFLELGLLAWGPFHGVSAQSPETTRRLVFETDPRAPARMHVIYGKNEAGKSTTLRAIAGLLYGIPHKTPDAHAVRMPDLRISARLATADGTILDVVRRKGNSNTLLDAAGAVLDEAVLKKILAGVGPELFARTFGLDHVTLRAGGEAMLAGQGDLGETLFGAGIGGTEAHKVLLALRAEADALFSPHAKTRPLNEAIRAHAQIQKEVKDTAMSASAWNDQEAELLALAHEKSALLEERERLVTEKKRIERALDLVPKLSRRAAVQKSRTELGPLVLVPESAALERQEAARALAESSRLIARVDEEIAELAKRARELVVPEALLGRAGEVEELHGRARQYRDSVRELAAVRAEKELLEEHARRALLRIPSAGATWDLDSAERLRIDAATQIELRRLVRDRAQTEGAMAQIDRARAELAREEAALGARPEGEPRAGTVPRRGPTEEAVRALERAAMELAPHADLEERLRVLEERAGKLARELERRVAKLAPCFTPPALDGKNGGVIELPTLAVPSLESVEAAEREASRIEQAEARVAESARSTAAQAAKLARDIDAFRRAASVPTEDDLTRARAEREQAWDAVRGAWRGREAKADAAGLAALENGFEDRVRVADGVADRLRREAERVTRLGQLLAEEAACAKAASEEAAEAAALEKKANRAATAFAALFAPAGIAPLSPHEMRGWLARHEAAAETSAAFDEARREVADAKGRARDVSARLREALEGAGELPLTLPRALAALVAHAGERARELRKALRAEEERARAKEQLAAKRAKIIADRAAVAQELAGYAEAWARGAKALGLAEDASPEVADAMLAAIADLFKSKDDAMERAGRERALMAAMAQIAEDVERLAQKVAPDLEGGDVVRVAQELAARFQAASDTRTRLSGVTEQIAKKSDEKKEYEGAHARAVATIEALVRAAGVPSLDDFDDASRRSIRARELDQRITELDRGILETAGTVSSVAALEAELVQFDPDAGRARLDAIDARLEAVDERRGEIERKYGGIEAGLRAMRESNAADAAERAEEALARARTCAEKYVRVRLAATLLGREIERYRETHQGPLLGRASELFNRLTRGAYRELGAGFDENDRPVLRCVRAALPDVGVDGLSDGTRDQLFLALRLASLERYAKVGEPLPLVLDDALVHFDDDRAKAALEVLGEVAGSMQVLFFTHHARLVNLAKAAVTPSVLAVHALDAASRAAPERESRLV